MNFIEAIKSGKQFKRPHFNFYIRSSELKHYSFTWEDYLAEDWVAEEYEITITTSQFNEAVRRTGNLYYKDQWYWADALKKELGL